MENNKKSLQQAINSIKLVAEKKGKNVTEEEIAKQANLSIEQLHAYLNGDKNLPDGLIIELLSSYGIKIREVHFIEQIYLPIPPMPLEDEAENEE